uniref:Integrator complex subunit 4 n=1 Tax=Photinus pyralis TaxID=7054 RepID=A0A1Y1KGH3_PHOPY
MAAVLKKRALAEYSQSIVQEAPFEPQLKRFRLVKKQASGRPTLALISCLQNCKNSNEALQTLLRLIDTFEFEPPDIIEAVKKLSEHFKSEPESAVRVKILSLLADIGHEQKADLQAIIDETLLLLKNERSHKVIAQGINTILKLGKLSVDNGVLHLKLLEIVKHYLKDVSHSVKCKCLEVIGTLTPITADLNTNEIVHLISSYFNNEDARVRSQAFSTLIVLHERGMTLNPDIYMNVCQALKDDYEIVRLVVIKLIRSLGEAHPENLIMLPDSEQEVRLIDDAFGKVCSGLTDLSMRVRTLAAKLLGSMTQVSNHFLNQTLDKKLISNMRRKRTAHELAWENVTSGEWASGKKWADDQPKEMVDADSINLMSSGACGAFVHGLEDEYLEVRTAAVESLCQLAMKNPDFANLSLDFLVDMFNDEIEEVRLMAIDSLRRISEHIILRDDQLETILGALEDFSQDVREGLHQMLASCRMSTTGGLKMCIEKLLDNLKKYPQDKRSTYRCLQKVGAQHPELVLPLIPPLLCIHPFFDTSEPDVDNPQYICILILILNAAKYSPTISPLLEPHTLRHYAYLRDTMPNFVPELSLSEGTGNTIIKPASVPESFEFLKTIVNSLNASEVSYRVQTNLLQMAKEHLNRLSEMDSSIAGIAQFTSLYIGAQLLYAQIFEKGLWKNPSTLATQQANILKTNIDQLLENCLKMQYLFVSLAANEQCSIKQFRLRALALNLIFIVKASNSSALAPCHHFLGAVEEMQRELVMHGLEPDSFASSVFKELSVLEEPKPGAVARLLIPILSESKLAKIPVPNSQVRMSSAVIIEPSNQTDSTLKFTAGLTMAVPLEAELFNLSDPSRLRLIIKYPDQRTHVILPRPAHLKPLFFDNDKQDSHSGHNLRLLTTVLISHQVWSEACNVDISIALSVPEADIAKKKFNDSSSILHLCKPQKISVAPKPIKRGI